MQPQKLNSVIIALLFMALIGCEQASKTMLEANKDVVRHFNEAFNNKDLDLRDELIAANFLRHSQATHDVKITSLEEFKQLNKQFLSLFRTYTRQLKCWLPKKILLLFIRHSQARRKTHGTVSRLRKEGRKQDYGTFST